MKKQVAFTLGAGVLFVLALLIYGCDGSGDSPTSTTPVAVPTVDVATAPAPEVNPGDATEPWTEAVPSQVSVKVRGSDGRTRVVNDSDETFTGHVCAYINGPHPQVLVGEQRIEVPAGESRTFDLVYDAKLSCGTIELQVDAGHISCKSPSNMLGDGLMDYAFPTVDFRECECRPKDIEVVSEGEPYKGEPTECLDALQTAVEQCFQCFQQFQDFTLSDGCREWKDTRELRPIKEEVECPCEVEWIKDTESTYDHDGEWSECELGIQTQDIFHVYYETNSCTQERRVVEDSEFVYDTREQECQTPGQCYYKVSGNSEPVKEWICEHTPGTFLPLTFGVWLNFDGGALDNHCQYPTPGIINSIFQLTPGQSDPGCYDKHDD